MRKTKIAIGTAVGLLIVIVVTAFWFKQRYSMNPANEFEVGEPSITAHVLIATQGSAYKDALVLGVVNHFKSRPVYIKVTDVSRLPTIREEEWSAVVLIHTWEIGKPQPDAQAFAQRVGNSKKLIVVTTSGSGEEKLPDVDAISSASSIADSATQVNRIAKRLDALVGN